LKPAIIVPPVLRNVILPISLMSANIVKRNSVINVMMQFVIMMEKVNILMKFKDARPVNDSMLSWMD
jgi:hypothetical protein